MARPRGALALVGVLLVASLTLVACASEEDDMMAQMLGGRQFGRQHDTKAPAVKSDLPLIRCSACSAVAKQAVRAVQKLRDEATKAKKMTETDILDVLETMCNPDVDAGDWITFQDLVEDGDELKLVTMDEARDCDSECRTIARSCHDTMESADLVDIGELLWAKEKRAAVTQALCRDQTAACRKPDLKIPKGRPAGGEFKAMPKEDLDMAKMMKKMKASGMGGTIFNKDDMLKRATDEAAVGDGMGGLGMGADPVIGMGGEGIPPMPDPDGWDAKKFAEVELKAAELAAQKQARGEEL